MRNKSKPHDIIATEKLDETTIKVTFADGQSILVDRSDYEKKGVFSIKLKNGLVLRSDWADDIPPGM